MKKEDILVFLKKKAVFFFLLICFNSYSQYVFKSGDLPDKISLEDYTSFADVGQNQLDIQFVLKNFK